MSEESEKKKLTIGDFKNQVGLMVQAISHFSSSDRSEAFGYLQNCVKNLEPCYEDEGLQINGSEKSQVNEDFEELNDSLKDNDSKSDDNHDSPCPREKENDENCMVDKCETDCLICGLKFSDIQQVYLHGLKEHPGSIESCSNCNETFGSLQIYQIHISLKNCSSSKQDCPENLVCQYCDKKYQNFQHYSLHIEGHKRNKCEECGKHFNSRKNLEGHTSSVHNKELQKNLFECKFCDRKYSQKRSLLKHYKLLHSKDNIICLTCGKIFEKYSDLKSHEKTHVNNTFLCNSCGDKFSRRQQYLIHLKEHDKYQCITCKISCSNKMKLEKHERAGHVIKGLPTNHQCSTCGIFFHFQSSLFFHKKTHSVSSEDSYGCEPCQRIFKNYPSYREHLLTEQHLSSVNSNEIPDLTSCKYCNKAFFSKRRLFQHVNKFHFKGKEVFHCDICDFKTNAKSSLYKHQKLHTKKKEFICEKCGDSFYTKNALLDHFNYVHNDERNFNCEKCGQTFKSASVLNRHMLCHNNESTYKCHCGQAYKFSGNLTRHQLLVHGKTSKSKRVKRLVTDEVANLTSKTKKKQETKEKQPTNNAATIYALIDPQAVVSLPLEHIIAQGNLLLSGAQPEPQMLQTPCHNMNFSIENRTQLVLSQNLDIAALREVDTLLQSEDSLKTTDTNETVGSATQNIFGRHLSDTDGNAFLDSESLIHPPIEPSLVTSLDDASLNSVPDQSNSQPHLLSGEPYYNIHFLDI